MNDLKCYRCDSWPCECADGCAVLWGDCREVLAQLADASIDMIFTDPPYGHNNNNGDLIHRWEAALGRRPPSDDDSSLGRPIANDGPEANELVRWLFSESRRLLADCCCCCCCCGGGGGPDPQFALWSLWMNECLAFKQMIVWDKGPMGMGWHYRRSYETVLVAQRGTGTCRWFDESKKIENIIRPGDYGIRKIIPRADQHPTEKPPELAAHFMHLHSQPGDLVLDPFMGSGSTAIAAKRMGRRFTGIELEEQWVARAANRLANEPMPLFREAVAV